MWVLFSRGGNFRNEGKSAKNAKITPTRKFPRLQYRSSGGVVVKLLAYRAGGRGSIPGLASTISEIGYLLLPSRNMAERSLKRHESSKTNITVRNGL